jgi:hypothetical protein
MIDRDRLRELHAAEEDRFVADRPRSAALAAEVFAGAVAALLGQ